MPLGHSVITGTIDEVYVRQLFGHLGFILIGVDADLRICLYNDQAARHFADRGEPLDGRPIVELMDQADRSRAEELLRAAIERQAVGEMEIKYVHEDGRRATLVFIVSPIVGEGDEPLGVSIAMRDISLRKRMSQELARARRMGALGQMAQGVVHHFNNILGGMLTSIDCVLASDSPRELRRTLRILAQSIARATRITQQLEAFAESRRQLPEWSDLNKVMAGFIAQLERKSERAQVRLETDIQPVRPRQVEVQRIVPVLESLTQNAFDAMTSGDKLFVSMAPDGDHAVITIRDEGCGIPEDVLDRAFEPFFTTKGELAGGGAKNPGLGLAAVHGLVAEIGGEIELTSKVGTGTTVVVRLPYRDPATGPTADVAVDDAHQPQERD